MRLRPHVPVVLRSCAPGSGRGSLHIQFAARHREAAHCYLWSALGELQRIREGVQAIEVHSCVTMPRYESYIATQYFWPAEKVQAEGAAGAGDPTCQKGWVERGRHKQGSRTTRSRIEAKVAQFAIWRRAGLGAAVIEHGRHESVVGAVRLRPTDSYPRWILGRV